MIPTSVLLRKGKERNRINHILTGKDPLIKHSGRQKETQAVSDSV